MFQHAYQNGNFVEIFDSKCKNYSLTIKRQIKNLKSI